MARKRAGLPALYELMGNKGLSAPVRKRRKGSPPGSPGILGSSDNPDHSTPLADETQSSWLSPGKMLKLPVGYILLSVAIGLGLVAASFILGYQKAEKVVSNEYQKNSLLGGADLNSLKPQDPLMAPPVQYPGNTSLKFDLGTAVVEPEAQKVTKIRDSAPAGGPGPIFTDPRVSGLNYFVLMETSQSGAERVVRFCRKNGLETYAIARNNARLYRVIALPGFSSSQRSSDGIRALEALIHRVGDKWKRDNGGTTDFRDTYPSLYSG